MIKWELLADQVEARFQALGTKSPEVLRSLEAYTRVLRTRIQLGFRMSKSPDGKPWKPLNPILTRVGQPLRNTGRLYGSVQVRRDGDGFVVGTNLRTPGGEYSLGAIHQYGAHIEPVRGRYLVWAPAGMKGLVFAQSVTIPARPFMPVNAAGQVDLPPAWAQSALSAMARALGLKS